MNNKEVVVKNMKVVKITAPHVEVIRDGELFKLSLSGVPYFNCHNISTIVRALSDPDLASFIEAAFTLERPTAGNLRKLSKCFDIIFPVH